MTRREALTALTQFRQTLYDTALGQRKDSLCDTLDAILTTPTASTLARLSRAPGFRRGWASVPDALADGTVDLDQLRPLLVRALPAPAAATPPTGPARPLWVVDGSTWPRPEAKTSPARTYCRRVTPGVPQDGVVPGWEYQWLVAVSEPQGSWALPLDVRRRAPPLAPDTATAPAAAPRGGSSPATDGSDGTPTALAIDQLRTALGHRPAGAPRPLAALDSGYDPVQLARAQQAPAGLDADLLVRLASHRVFFRDPGPYPGKGRPRKHGPVFRCKEPATHGPPDQEATLEDPDYGTVTVKAWGQLHVRHAPDTPFTVLRVQVGRLPRRATPPQPLWLAWIGGPLPADLHQLWRWYLRRFVVEHLLRFCKQTLGWTTVRPRDPAAADRWTWLVVLALWQLWLARPLVADRRLPWERPLPPEHLSPGRVQRAFAGLLAGLGSPARAPLPRGKSPGRRRGQSPGPCPRFAVVRRTPKRPKRGKPRAKAAA